MRKKTTSNTGFRNGNPFCFNCGGSFKPDLPMEVKKFSEILKAFDRLHKYCKKKWEEPVPTPDMAPTQWAMEKNAFWWWDNGDRGESSICMYYRLLQHPISINHYQHPEDPSDFYRVYKLVQAVPQFKDALPQMRLVSKYWRAVVDNWITLVKMLEEQIAGNDKNGMYEFMQEIYEKSV